MQNFSFWGCVIEPKFIYYRGQTRVSPVPLHPDLVPWFLPLLQENNSSKRQTHIVEMRLQVYLWNTSKHKAVSRPPASPNTPHIEEIKLLVSLFYTLERRLQVGTWLIWVRYWGSGVTYFSQFLASPSSSPYETLGIMYSYKDFLSQLVKALCLSEIVTEAPFSSTVSRAPLPLCYLCLWCSERRGNLIRQAQGCWVVARQVSLLLLP